MVLGFEKRPIFPFFGSFINVKRFEEMTSKRNIARPLKFQYLERESEAAWTGKK